MNLFCAKSSCQEKGEGHVPEKIVLEKKEQKFLTFFVLFYSGDSEKKRKREPEWTMDRHFRSQLDGSLLSSFEVSSFFFVSRGATLLKEEAFLNY